MPRMTRAGTTRRTDTRKAAARDLPQFKPAQLLDTPPPQAGYEHRWIRESTINQPDPGNVSNRWQQGWRPVLADRYPEWVNHVQIPGEEKAMSQVIRRPGLILCERPIRTGAQHREYLRREAAEAMGAVSEGLEETLAPLEAPVVNESSKPQWLGAKGEKFKE